MKACVLVSPAPVESNPLRIVETAKPKPAPGQVLVRVSACGVCRTVLHVVEGELPRANRPSCPATRWWAWWKRTARTRRGSNSARAWAFPGCTRLAAFANTAAPCARNLCEHAVFTGWMVDGCYAEYAVAPEDSSTRCRRASATCMWCHCWCAGIIGFRSLRLSGVRPGGRLAMYGFGAAAHVAIQVARHWNIGVYAISRDPRHRKLALDLGAVWAGGSD